MRETMSRFAPLILACLWAACAPTLRPIVPNTPEGNKCRRECMAVFEQCMSTYNESACDSQETSCLKTCPGATMPGNGKKK